VSCRVLHVWQFGCESKMSVLLVSGMSQRVLLALFIFMLITWFQSAIKSIDTSTGLLGTTYYKFGWFSLSEFSMARLSSTKLRFISKYDFLSACLPSRFRFVSVISIIPALLSVAVLTSRAFTQSLLDKNAEKASKI